MSSSSYTPSYGSFTCFPCPMGTFQTTGANDASSVTDAYEIALFSNFSGLYSIGSTPNTCSPCPINTYNPYVGGAAGVNDYQSGCMNCPDGTFALTGSYQCSKCPAGTSRNMYPNINSGNYENVVSGGQCQFCQPGFYADSAGMSRCLPCPAGSYSSDYGATYCTLCPLGQSSYQGNYDDRSVASNKETVSTFNDNPNFNFQNRLAAAPNCVSNPFGYFTDTFGLPLPLPCRTGTYALQGQSYCQLCPEGSYQSNFASDRCVGCPVGTAQSLQGAFKCTTCTAGTFSIGAGAQPTAVGAATVPGQTACTPCGLGYYQPSSGTDTCIACAAGTYADVTGLAKCKLCQAGREQPGTGQPTCAQCDAGYYSSYGSALCTACPTGSITPKPGTSRCTTCPPGFYANLPSAAFACRACPAGYYSPYNGTYSADGYTFGPKGCFKCPPNTYSNRPGSSACTLCQGQVASNFFFGNWPNGASAAANDGLIYCTDGDGATRCKPCSLLRPAPMPPNPPRPPPPSPPSPLPPSPPPPSPPPPSPPP
eukprot:CAMPEP_0175067188 /NCGR_PEP_ID=MMETSP0052_2-20121109/16948_1 /TAXON_ID=51329 ORGANISM="Polytomella parva, Strain SAG 63-3" /NCGR_SAMPLE_ID=MMETSP0052_2 /ASSEMBLY_ACC=CAM_ASM_000194 /LENGTH=536 /DNA_ID=CAMNT_0016334019 /DNA_START=580 /DNA_END=2187 /DNA_ORIENTATION=+